jgi:hypothetical protein
MKPGDFKDISVSKLLHSVQSAQLLNKWIQGLHKGSEMVDVHNEEALCFIIQSISHLSALDTVCTAATDKLW